MRYLLRVTVEGREHDIICTDALDLLIDGGNLKALGAKDLRAFGIVPDESSGTTIVAEVFCDFL